MPDRLLNRVRYSLKYRIAAIIFVLEAIMMTAVLGVTLNHSQAETEKQLKVNQQVMFNLLRDLSRIALLTSEYDELQPYVEQIVTDPSIEAVMLADNQYRIVVSSNHESIGKPLAAPQDQDPSHWIQQDITNENGRLGSLTMRFSRSNIMRASREARNLGITVALSGMIVIAIVGILIGFLLTRRLDRLAMTAQMLAGGRMDVQTGLTGHDEVAVAGRAFDSMAQSIRMNVQALQRAADMLEDRVTERTAELAEARDEAINANRIKSAFLANMSHEIRTPLTAIIGFSETLLDSEQSMAERVDSIHTIIRSGKHLLQIINDILDVSKLEAGKVDVEYIPVDIFQLLEDVHSIVYLLAREKGLYFYLDYTFPLPQIIVSDPLRLKQVLINLCNNAIKFTNHGTVRIKVAFCDKTGKLVLKVIDTGVGLAPAQQAHIFDAFSQADISTSRQFGGTGLGLYLSRQLANRLGGDILVESTLDVGSCFTVSIEPGPLDKQKFVTHIPSTKKDCKPSITSEYRYLSGTVLVAEDNIDNQKLTSLLITKIGAQVDIAENGQKAVEKALSREYDLILMDMQMPVMSGPEATRHLRDLGYRGPIVALTANAMKADVDSCMSAGCDGFVSKPIQREQLYNLLAQHLQPGQSPTAQRTPLTSSLLDQDPDLQDLVSEFVRHLPVAIDEIRAQLDAADLDTLKSKIHQLKGTCGNFGYEPMYKLCQKIEFELAAEHLHGIRKLVDELDVLLERMLLGLPSNVYALPAQRNSDKAE